MQIIHYVTLGVAVVLLMTFSGCAMKHRVQPPQVITPIEHPAEIKPESKPEIKPELPAKQPEPEISEPVEPEAEISESLPPSQPDVPAYQPKTGPAAAVYADAEKNLDAGNLDKAEMLLERALRIEPRNAHYWYTMARIKYQQKQYKQTIQFCLKSNSLAMGIPQLTKLNFSLMEEAKAKQ